MARATRSSAAHEKDKQTEPTATTAVVSARGKAAASKKRKRTSIADGDDQPASKQLRSGDVSIKEEGGASLEPEEQPGAEKLADLQHVGDVPINDNDAQKILDILEMIDTQGLLDRVFPLHSNSIEASSSQPASYSFRTLLKESHQHPLCVLRSAVKHLFPISSHPRARPSIPAAQQLSFCNLALSLLDQASFHSISIPLDLESILPFIQNAAIEDSVDLKSNPKSKSKSPSRLSSAEPINDLIRQRKYALMQKLSGGEWWTSLNSDFGAPTMDGKDLKDLPTAHAELVSILPAPSTSASKPDPTLPIPTLGTFASKKPPGPKVKALGPRRTSCGRFLDYGPYASFAPSFEGEGVEVGRRALGETVWRWHQRSRAAETEKYKPTSIVEVHEVEDVVMDEVQEVSPTSAVDMAKVTEDSLEGLLPPDEIVAIKAAMGTLELENMVHELLERNRRALGRLVELQRTRLGAEGGGSSVVEEGSEEWDTAQGILNSLTILASLRPRSSKDTSDTPPLIPPASVLHKLHRTLPVAPTQGWYGTLSPSRPSALRDDATIHIKSGAVVPVAEQIPAAPPAAVNGTNAHGYPYAGQPYPSGSFPQQQLKGKPYYPPGQYGAPPPQVQGQTAGAAAQYYQNQQHGQSQYQYGSYYYPPQGQVAVASGASTNGRATPQPSGATNTNFGGGFYAYNAQQQQLPVQRAVANTVMAAAGKVNGTVPPTLPPHMRNAAWSAASASQPGTPGGVGMGLQQNSYYGSYQPATPAR